MVRVVAFVIALALPTSAFALPAWEVSNAWRCKIATAAACSRDKACVIEPMEMWRDINFDENKVWLVGLDEPHEYFWTNSILTRDFDGGGTYFSTERQLFLMLPNGGSDQANTRDFSLQVASLSTTGNSSIMYGSCSPLSDEID
jgi:hypothetical protein